MNVSFIRDMREQKEIRQKATTMNKMKDRRIKKKKQHNLKTELQQTIGFKTHLYIT